ncbi:hypothetical protein GGR52DRAFT_380009 [Hypoxylon sp. FL1284]|nr:hypothetical protein GGR52DRAFT_380009 [Hypoxylon sp. FL1284]
MTRKLPWNRDEKSTLSSPQIAKQTPVRQAKVKRDDIENKEGSGVKASNSTSDSATPSRIARPGSTSPPPEPLPETYMVEGLEQDDLYRMVEDEFLSTAQQYTAHLHAAEYHRLKAATKSQNADAIRDISRPVVGRMTDLVKIKQDRKARLQKQKMATRKAAANRDRSHDHTETEDDDEWHSASLHGLMESPRKQAARLDNPTKMATSTTRAAAGFDGAKPRLLFPAPSSLRSGNSSSSRPPPKMAMEEASETEEDDDDDPDRLPPDMHAKTRLTKNTPTQSVSSNGLATRQLTTKPHPINPPKQSQAVNNPARSTSPHGDFLSGLKRRQEERKQHRGRRKTAASKEQSAEVLDDIIPGFL